MASVSDFVSEDTGLISHAVSGFVPRSVLVPFKQDECSLQPLVQVGESVREGQTIAQGKTSSVQATIPGVVEAISIVQYPDGKQGKAAKINLGGSFSFLGKRKARIDWKTFTPSTILTLLTEKGVVNTFDHCVSLAGQIHNLHTKSARILAVRLFDDDPSRVTEKFIAEHYWREVAEGISIVAKAMDASGVVFCYDSEKKLEPIPQADSLFPMPQLSCSVNVEKYPAGFSHEIAAAVKKVSESAPFNKIGNRDLYIDSMTALAVYNAIVCSVPLMERYVHVTGDCLNAISIMKVKIGTTLGDLAKQCGGFKRPVAKIVINGLVTGFSVSSLSIPVTKMVKSVAFLPAKKACRQYTEQCIRCGDCRKICPVGLYPDMLYRSFLHGKNGTELEKQYAATSILCTGCGLCDAVCPSRLPLNETAVLLKGRNDEE
ncbi:MAG: 4Fe-4S dicluster domain-containing protein [Treponema sp.]|nr:4Fe-4S dicluster domain-containing protein [Treponema sp.]